MKIKKYSIILFCNGKKYKVYALRGKKRYIKRGRGFSICTTPIEKDKTVICWTDPLGVKNAVYSEKEFLKAAKKLAGNTKNNDVDWWIEYFGAKRVTVEQCKKYMKYYPKAREEVKLSKSFQKLEPDNCSTQKCSN